MTDEVIRRVRQAPRYAEVDGALLARVAEEELRRAGNPDDAVKRVKRRLHQAVGAFRRAERATRAGRTIAELTAAWGVSDQAFMAACRRALERHASTRERLPEIDRFYEPIWTAIGGAPATVLDLACGLNPLALPFMGLPAETRYLACDVDHRPLEIVEAFLSLVGQPHRTWACDLVAGAPHDTADVALLLKTVPLLDRQDAGAAARLIKGLGSAHAVVSFASRSLGGRGRGQESTYRRRMEGLLTEVAPRIGSVTEASVPGELVFVLELRRADG